MTTEMYLTEFRNDLSAIIDQLAETGPVRLMRNSQIVAEIRSATHDGERLYAESVLGTFRYLEKLSDNYGGSDEGIQEALVDLGIDTLAALAELVDRHKRLAADGVTFDDSPSHALPTEGPITVDDALAHLYFGDEYPKTGDTYEWFTACARLQAEATKRDMSTTLPAPNAYDEEAPTFVELAISSGHTPESLTAFGINALEQGVQLERLAEMFGSEPVPADVLAMSDYRDFLFEELTQAGLPHAEAVAVFRKGVNPATAAALASAGLRDIASIEQVIADKTDIDLVRRAARDGLSADEWRVQVPKIQHLKYPGIGRSYLSSDEGVLPFRLLVKAVEEKVSLVHWDTNSMKVDADRIRSFYADKSKRQTMYPWNLVYGDESNILTVGRAKIYPSYITAFGKLMEHVENWGETGFTDLAVQVKALGLTTDMANAMSRSDSKRPKFTPAQLVSVLEEGLSDAATAHYLADLHDKPEEWIDFLRERRDRQLMTDTFVATVENTDAWTAVKSGAANLKKTAKVDRYYMRGNVYTKWIIEKFADGKPLNDYELMSLLVTVRHYAFGSNLLAFKQWREENDQYATAVAQLSENFDKMRAASTAA